MPTKYRGGLGRSLKLPTESGSSTISAVAHFLLFDEFPTLRLTVCVERCARGRAFLRCVSVVSFVCIRRPVHVKFLFRSHIQVLAGLHLTGHVFDNNRYRGSVKRFLECMVSRMYGETGIHCSSPGVLTKACSCAEEMINVRITKNYYSTLSYCKSLAIILSRLVTHLNASGLTESSLLLSNNTINMTAHCRLWKFILIVSKCRKTKKKLYILSVLMFLCYRRWRTVKVCCLRHPVSLLLSYFHVTHNHWLQSSR